MVSQIALVKVYASSTANICVICMVTKCVDSIDVFFKAQYRKCDIYCKCMSVRASVCVRAGVCGCMRACARVRVCECVCVLNTVISP